MRASVRRTLPDRFGSRQRSRSRSTASVTTCPSAMCDSCICMVTLLGTSRRTSAWSANLPPPSPVIATTPMPALRAASQAARTLAELPLVEMPISTSPGRPSVSTCLAKIPRNRNHSRRPSGKSCPWSGRAPTDRHGGDDGQGWPRILRQDAVVGRRAAIAAQHQLAAFTKGGGDHFGGLHGGPAHCSAVRRFTSAEVSRMSVMDLAVKSVISAPCWTRHGARLTGDSATAIHGYHRVDGTSRTPR